jgi:GntR family transcriptional regulator
MSVYKQQMAAQPPILRVDLSAATPAYRQIVDGLRAMLVAGSFDAGDQLPTVRQLAMDLGVHHNTVAEAYRELEQEGWLALARRRGAIVKDRRTPSPGKSEKESFIKRVRELAAQAISSGLSPTAVADGLVGAAREIETRSKGG